MYYESSQLCFKPHPSARAAKIVVEVTTSIKRNSPDCYEVDQCITKGIPTQLCMHLAKLHKDIKIFGILEHLATLLNKHQIYLVEPELSALRIFIPKLPVSFTVGEIKYGIPFIVAGNG